MVELQSYKHTRNWQVWQLPAYASERYNVILKAYKGPMKR